MYIHTYIHTYIHRYIHTYIHTLLTSSFLMIAFIGSDSLLCYDLSFFELFLHWTTYFLKGCFDIPSLSC